MIKIASGYRNINVESPLHVAGQGINSSSTKTSMQTGQLEVNGLLLELEKTKILVISVDTLFIGNRLRIEIESHFKDTLNPTEIFIAASHTHSAPMLDFDKPKLGIPNIDYYNYVLNNIIELCEYLLNTTQKSTALFKNVNYNSAIGISRRKFRIIGEGRKSIFGFNRIFNLPNEKNKIYQPARLIQICNERGESTFIWNQACHPVSIPDAFGHSPGYIGDGRELLRENFGHKTPVIFLQGFSGDIRPNSTKKIKNFSSLIRRILFGKQFTNFQKNDYISWISKLKDEMIEQINLLHSVKFFRISNLILDRESKKLSKFKIESSQSDKNLSKHTIIFGPFKVIGFSGEVLSKIAASLTKMHSGTVIPVGCIDDTFGYLPDVNSIKFGGYEVNGFWPYFNIENIPKKSFYDLICWICKHR
jgi:hypothetical protein